MEALRIIIVVVQNTCCVAWNYHVIMFFKKGSKNVFPSVLQSFLLICEQIKIGTTLVFKKQMMIHTANFNNQTHPQITRGRAGCSETRFLGSRPRPRLCFFESQWRDETETFFLLSLNIETRPRLFFSESQCRDETETFFLLSLNVETRPRLFFSESQYRDETETLFLLRIDHFVVIQFEIDHIYS